MQSQAVNERIAVLDLGTNTFHLLLIELSSNDNFQIIDKIKESVKLGEGGIQNGLITPEAFERGIKALKKLQTIIASKNVKKTLAFATSAIRSAQNGFRFIEQIKNETGIEIQIINGNKEAALIYEGIKYGLTLPVHKDLLIVDIGGGSVEFIVANRLNAKLLRSINIGAARLLEIIKPSDPMTAEEEQRLESYLAQELKSLLQEIQDFNVHTLVGSSGTFETLAMIQAYENNEKVLADNLNGYVIDIKKFKKIYRKIVVCSKEQRLQIRGMDPMRVEMILMGAILVNYICNELNIQEIIVSSYALKEGILINYLNETLNVNPFEIVDHNQREQAVFELAKKFGSDTDKGRYVSNLALSLFDQTKFLHQFGALERELLYYAAMLVDVGHFINRSGHHKHGQYIIQNSGLPGFSGKELLLLANIVRYHRKSAPTEEHWHYNVLYRKEDKNIVNKLSAILRIAVNLNRAHRQVVRSVMFESDYTDTACLVINASVPATLEIEAVQEAKNLFEKFFNLKLNIIQE